MSFSTFEFRFSLEENHTLALRSSLGPPLGTTWGLLGLEKGLTLNSLGLLGHFGSSLGSLLELLSSLLELPGLTFGAPGLTFGAPGVTFGAPGLTFGAPGLTFGAPGLPWEFTLGAFGSTWANLRTTRYHQTPGFE